MVDLVKLAQEKSGMNPARNTEVAQEMIKKESEVSAGNRNVMATDKSIASVKKVETEWYFQSERPGFGFIYRVTHKQVKFEGLFYKTEDKRLAQVIRNSYGAQVTELSKEQYEEAIVLRPGAPEPVKSSIVVNRLPG